MNRRDRSTGERIFHVSESSDIERFEPRADPQGRLRVWAIGDSRLQNYLLPRDCPRVTYYATATTTAADRRTYFSVSDTQSVVAIEQAWFEAARTTRLHVYEFDATQFALEDAIAAYYVCLRETTPIAQHAVLDPSKELFRRNVELRVLSSLWPLRDAIAVSSLAFSMVRMRNAAPRSSDEPQVTGVPWPPDPAEHGT